MTARMSSDRGGGAAAPSAPGPADEGAPVTRFGGGRAVLVFGWTVVGSLLVLIATSYFGPVGPTGPDRLVAHGEMSALALVIAGAGAGLLGRGTSGWVASMAGLAAGLIVYAQTRIWMAEVIAGNTYVMPRDPFITGVFALLVAAAALVSVGYAISVGARTVLARRPPARPGRRGAAAIGVTALAIAVFAVGCAVWLSGTAVLIADQETAGVHRLTISEDALVLDASTIKAGPVTFLVTVSGHPPTDLGLVAESSVPTIQSIGTPPAGSVDYMISRGTLTLGTWRFTAGDGRLVARFEVVP